MKIKIGIPKDEPQIWVEIDSKRLKELIEKLPFKLTFDAKEGEEGGEH